jgi:hypothetical protein
LVFRNANGEIQGDSEEVLAFEQAQDARALGRRDVLGDEEVLGVVGGEGEVFVAVGLPGQLLLLHEVARVDLP